MPILPAFPPLPQASVQCRITAEGKESRVQEFKCNPSGAHSRCSMKPPTHPLVQLRLPQQALPSYPGEARERGDTKCHFPGILLTATHEGQPGRTGILGYHLLDPPAFSSPTLLVSTLVLIEFLLWEGNIHLQSTSCHSKLVGLCKQLDHCLMSCPRTCGVPGCFNREAWPGAEFIRCNKTWTAYLTLVSFME